MAVHTYLHNWVHIVRTKLLHCLVGGLDLERRYSSRRGIVFNKTPKPGLFTLLAAKIRRSRGYYDFYTLWLFRRLWLHHKSGGYLVQYLSFRRDLGYPISSEKKALLARYQTSLYGAKRGLAARLLSEPSKGWNATVKKNHWQNMQAQWQEQFVQYIKRQTKIVVIGNSPQVAQQQVEQHIDRQNCVVRFNHCFGQTAVGRKLDVWIQSPAYQGPKPKSYDFRLISGPAVEYQLKPKTTNRILDGGPAVSIPLSIWRELVRELAAPPSAGILTLAWLKQIQGSWQAIQIAGMGFSGQTSYHQADQRYLPASRHNWQAEIRLLERWQQEGLASFSPSPAVQCGLAGPKPLFALARDAFESKDFQQALKAYQDIIVQYPDLSHIAQASIKLCKNRLDRSLGGRLPTGIWWAPLESHPRRRQVFQYPAPKSAFHEVWVLIPVYNAYDEVKACLQSVDRYSHGASGVLVINDASTDPRIETLLADYDRRAKWQVIHHQHNRGYTKTINEAIQKAGEADVILLNSDCIVGPRWLENLRIAAYSREQIASATPLSNSAGAFSAPKIHTANPIPAQHDFDDLARAVQQLSLRYYPEVPTGHGFCLYMKRQCLDQIGLMDETAFPRGYGEENDLCQRAIAKGWKHVIDDATYVFHHQSASFGQEKLDLIETAQGVLKSRYPSYQQDTAIFKTDPKIQAARDQVGKVIDLMPADQSVKLRVLYVLANRDGGTPLTNQDLMQGLDSRIEAFVLECNRQEIKISLFKNLSLTSLESASLKEKLRAFPHRSDEYDCLAAGYLIKYGIEVLHIRHLGWHSLGLIEQAKQLGVRVVMSYHDFYTICPNVKLIDEAAQYCAGKCTVGMGPCKHELWPKEEISELKGKKVYSWRDQFRSVLALADSHITTSEHARKLIMQHYPEITPDSFHVIEHGRDFPTTKTIKLPDFKKRPIHMLIAGHITIAKGGLIIRDLCQRLGRDHLEVHLLGTIVDRSLGLEDLVIRHGPYERDQFVQRVSELKPDIGAVLSIWPETYCHVLSEMWAAGLMVVGLDIGAVGERIRAKGLGWVIGMDGDIIGSLVDLLLGQGGHKGELEAWQSKSLMAMADGYWRLYQHNLQKTKLS